jgi:type IV secretion/conjugal transfer VirB4 family ATPase
MSALTSLLLTLSGFVAGRLVDALRDYQPPRRGLVDLLPWAFLVEREPQGVVLNKDGSFTAAFEIQGPDRASSTDEQLNSLSAHVSRAFGPFVTSWTFHFDAVRRPAPSYPEEGDFPDPVTRLLDDCRRQAYLQHGALYETTAVLCATFRPPREVYQHLLLRLQQGVQLERRHWEDTLESFERQLESLESRLSGPIRVRPLNGAELLAHLNGCLNGRHHLVNDPGDGVYLDQILATQHLTTGWEPVVGSNHLAFVALFHLPGRITPAHLDALNDLPYPYRLSVRFTPLDMRSAQSVIDRYSRGWFWMQRSARDMLTSSQPASTADPFVNRHAVDMLEDGADATRLNHEAEHRFAYFTACLVLSGATRVEANDRAAATSKILEDRGYSTRIETYNAPAAFHGSLPGETAANLRAPLVNLVPIADLMPLTALWPGLNRHPCQFFPPSSPPILIGRTEGSTPFRLYLHSGDLGHTIIVGPPGAGKSTHLEALATGWLRYPGSRIYFFDRDHSARLLAKAIGATYYDLGAAQISFQPLRRIDNEAERAVAISWLEALLALQIQKLSPQQSQLLARAVQTLASAPPEHRTLLMLRNQVQDPEISTALAPFVKGGPYASYLDGGTDSLADGRVQIFEMRRLLELEAKAHLPVLLYLLNRIESSLDGSPTLIVLDEAGLALLHEVFASRINQWALTLRKKNAVIVLAVQALSQLENNHSFSTLLQSCPTRIYLPNPDAISPSIRPIYEACGLNPRQIELIASSMRRKRDYYLANPDGCRLYGLALTPAELAFFGTLPGRSLQETHAVMDQHIDLHGDGWAAAWLRTCGLAAEAETLDNQLDNRNKEANP